MGKRQHKKQSTHNQIDPSEHMTMKLPNSNCKIIMLTIVSELKEYFPNVSQEIEIMKSGIAT